jgi:hypothetical protein
MSRRVYGLQHPTTEIYILSVPEEVANLERRHDVLLRIEALGEGLPDHSLSDEVRHLAVGKPLLRRDAQRVVEHPNLPEAVVVGDVVVVAVGVDDEDGEVRDLVHDGGDVGDAAARVDEGRPGSADDEGAYRLLVLPRFINHVRVPADEIDLEPLVRHRDALQGLVGWARQLAPPLVRDEDASILWW